MMHWIAIAILQTLPAGEPVAGVAPPKSPLHEAAASGDTDRLKELLTAGVEVDSLDDVGQTPLHKAAAHGRPEAVKLLLDKGADANAQDANGKTPLQLVREAMRQYWDSGKSIPHRYRNLHKLLGTGGPDAGKKQKGFPSYSAARTQPARRLSDRERFEWFLENGGDIHAKDELGGTFLGRASESGSKGLVEILIAHGADVSVRDGRGRTALHAAAEGYMRDSGWSHLTEEEASRKDHLGTVMVLLENGAAPSAPDNHGNTPLHLAASGGRRDVAEVLLSYGADIDAENSLGRTPLGSAVWAVGYLERDVTRSGGRGKVYPRTLAKLDRCKQFVEWLRGKGAVDSSAQGPDASRESEAPPCDPADLLRDSKPPLFSAETAEEARRLLRQGADINARGLLRQTALHEAAARGRAGVAGVLLEAGANVEEKGIGSYTPLHQVAIGHFRLRTDNDEGGYDYAATTRVLLDHGAKVNATARQDKKTPLHFAAEYGNVAVTTVLLKAGANVHARDIVGSTPLHAVASGRALHRTTNAHTTDSSQRYSEAAELILASGADVNAINSMQSTPLHSATVFCDRAVAKVLIAHGADINATSHSGETPLKAAQRGFSSIKSMSARMPSDDVAERTACFEWIIPWLEGQGAEE